MQVSPFRRGKALTCIYTEERSDLFRERPNWMFDAGYCAGMTLGRYKRLVRANNPELGQVAADRIDKLRPLADHGYSAPDRPRACSRLERVKGRIEEKIEAVKPAVPIKKSVTPDYIVSPEAYVELAKSKLATTKLRHALARHLFEPPKRFCCTRLQ